MPKDVMLVNLQEASYEEVRRALVSALADPEAVKACVEQIRRTPKAFSRFSPKEQIALKAVYGDLVSLVLELEAQSKARLNSR